MDLLDNLSVQLYSEDELSVQLLQENTFDIQLTADVIIVKPEEYDGEYTVIPKTYVQYLETTNKLMRDDVTVTEIPYDEVTNIYGKTAVIAS